MEDATLETNMMHSYRLQKMYFISHYFPEM